MSISQGPFIGNICRLVYLEATTYEVMRLAALAPWGLAHRALIDTDLAGYHIPKVNIDLANLAKDALVFFNLTVGIKLVY